MLCRCGSQTEQPPIQLPLIYITKDTLYVLCMHVVYTVVSMCREVYRQWNSLYAMFSIVLAKQSRDCKSIHFSACT